MQAPAQQKGSLTEHGSTISGPEMLRRLKAAGITHIIWLPDSESSELYHLVQADPDLTLVPVCREGESFAIAAGLLLGGKHPVVLIQSTGFFESGDSIRGIALWLRMPLPILVGYRGWQPEGRPQDSAALFLEPILDAWRIPYQLLRDDRDLDRLDQAIDFARAESRPVAVLIAGEWTGQ